jgi:glycosyltransferase involved in cell wall biosynthesis
MPDSTDDARPGLAIVANSMTPYRVNLHRLIAQGIPELKLHSIISHGVGDFDWEMKLPREIHATNFSLPGERPLDNPLRRPRFEFRKATQITGYLRETATRAVIFHGYRYIAYFRLMAYCYRNSIPFFVCNDSNIRGEPNHRFGPRVIKCSLYRWWMKRSSGVFSMGELGDQFFLKYGADPKRLYRLPYWPDYDAFAHVDEVSLEGFRRKFGLDRQRSYLMFSGRLIPQKRVDLVIDAFAAVAAQRPDWDLLVVGDGVLRDELHRRVPESLRSRVVWTGFVEGNESALSYHAADVLLLPSDHEPWAVVVQEAMAAGLAVVASDVVGAAHELVEDGVNGRIFPVGNLSELIGAIRQVTAADAIQAMKKNSRGVLAKYKQAVDPVAEVRRALADVGVLRSSVN